MDNLAYAAWLDVYSCYRTSAILFGNRTVRDAS
jgi:hypothetical protein